MPRIVQLPPTLVNQLAAGEVVERPASVVKELLENSVDAGATRIDVEVGQGGADLIRVADDGCGIAAEDLPLAFASHATSKLQDAEGLFRIGTLGFRGEALASVGSIAQVTLQSCPAGQGSGAQITCRGGELSLVAPWNGSQGTRIEVKHLFYNTPARRKFLRSLPSTHPRDGCFSPAVGRNSATTRSGWDDPRTGVQTASWERWPEEPAAWKDQSRRAGCSGVFGQGSLLASKRSASACSQAVNASSSKLAAEMA